MLDTLLRSLRSADNENSSGRLLANIDLNGFRAVVYHTTLLQEFSSVSNNEDAVVFLQLRTECH